MNPHVDLRQLAVHRDEPRPTLVRPRRFFSRYVLPGIVLLGFLGVMLWAGRDNLLPARPVTVTPVLASRVVSQPASGVLFQAAGWIEPRPTPVLVPALAEGIVEQLFVVENQSVTAGEPIARLIDADARLAWSAAEADLHLRESEAASLIAKVETDLLYLPYQMQSAEARLYLSRADLEGKQAAPGSVPILTIQRVESEVISARALFEELQVRHKRLTREATTLTRLRDALHQGSEEKANVPLPLTEAEVNMKSALNRVRQAQLALDAARLRLERMVVRAPISGRVLGLVARPGMRLMGMVPGTQQEASTVVTLYDPKSLQVRADVRLEDVPHVHPGQPARIETPAVPSGSLVGEVLFATSITDVQKNTLQVKVAIQSPPPVLKPDMLVQVTFLAPPSPQPVAGRTTETERIQLLIPRQLVEQTSQGAQVWLVDQVTHLAQPRTVQLGSPQGNDLVAVVDGLTVTDKLIVAGRERLSAGQRVRITGEDTTLGKAERELNPKPVRMSRLPVGDSVPKGKH